LYRRINAAFLQELYPYEIKISNSKLFQSPYKKFLIQFEHVRQRAVTGENNVFITVETDPNLLQKLIISTGVIKRNIYVEALLFFYQAEFEVQRRHIQ